MKLTRQQAQGVALGGLVVIGVAVYGRAFRSPASVTAPPSASSTLTDVAPTSDVAAPVVSLEHRQAQWQRAEAIEWNRDPFLRAGAPVSTGLNLSGIIWDAQRPMAMINGVAMIVGDEIEGFRVVEIQQDVVTLTDGEKTFQLRMIP